MKSLIGCLFVLLLAFMPLTIKAAHLVGGDISYQCLGNNKYEIKLRIYRDCGAGGAAFDNTVAIAVYDAGSVLIQEVFINIGPINSISTDSVGNNPCVTPPPGLCTEYADYIDTVTLPPLAGGYTLSWQRCCRNAAIQNIANPQDYGNTYTVEIPSNDVGCNSSPQFNGVPPIVFCINETLNLPLDVVEADGDSLYFELCDIFAGGRSTGMGPNCATTAITPSPACPPPYNTIPFIAPFTSSQPLPANPALKIDSLTGVITGKPDQLGRYVLGICVSEYRNGQFLSKVRLDYQFLTTNCIKTVVSDMVTPAEDPSILCDGLTVNFQSESVNTTKVFWNFGDPSTSADTSNLFNPSYTYTSPGSYKVTLIAEPGSPCGDTTNYTFDINVPVDPDFRYEGQTCFDAQSVNFAATGGYPANSTFVWDFGPDANIPVFNGLNPPTIMWSTPGIHYIEFTVSYGVCSHTTRDSIEISYLTTTIDAGPDQTVRAGQVVNLAASGGVEFYWFAEKQGIEISSRITQSTSIRTFKEDTIKVYVRVTDRFQCTGIDSLNIYVLKNDVDAPINFFSPDGNGLNDELDLYDLNPDNNCDISILNRWGSEVWSRLEYQNDWEGVDLGGNPLPDGTYYYILSCNGEIRYRAAVTLIRNP